MSRDAALAVLLQADKPAPDTSTFRIVCVALIVILVAVIFLRRKGRKKKSDEDEF